MNKELRLKYGYPIECKDCAIFESKPKNLSRIDPFHKTGKGLKLLLIGQDPTIFEEPDRVNTVLMLNETKGRNGQLRKWLERELFGVENFNKIEIYATNLVKCQFDSPPTLSKGGALKFLKPRFNFCKKHLEKEIENFKPDVVLTLGESAHKLFFKEIKITEGELKGKMKNDFTGKFIQAKFGDIEFSYSPCLHIKTFRVAETYGKQVYDFKNGLNERLKKAST
jgi:uracil-DNA glycosylase family 4